MNWQLLCILAGLGVCWLSGANWGHKLGIKETEERWREAVARTDAARLLAMRDALRDAVRCAGHS